jgi:replicative DNA helicase
MDFNEVPKFEELDQKFDLDKESEIVPLFEAAKRLEELRGHADNFPIGFDIFSNIMSGGITEGDLVVISGKSGHGKCHGKGTKILMFDGSIKNVEQIQIGDLLMGDDSTPRKVLSLGNGVDELYEICPIKGGDNFIVNSEHILVLKGSSKFKNHRITKNGVRISTRLEKIENSKEIEVSLKEFLKHNVTFKRNQKLFRVGVEFKEQQVPIEPYFLGLWLGDGSSNEVGITTSDEEIKNYLFNYANRLDLKVRTVDQSIYGNKSNIYQLTRPKNFLPVDSRNKHGYGETVSLKSRLVSLNMINNKHIPLIYKNNSRKSRLELLAGLIDSDGYKNPPSSLNFVNKNKMLCEDLVWLVRSLGLSASINSFVNKKYNKVYWKVGIYGDCSIIPCKLKRKQCAVRKQIKNHLVTGFSIKPLGSGEYYGFELDGNHRYLLGDFTVTHNTLFAQTISYHLNQIGLPQLWFSYEMEITEIAKRFADMGLTQDYLGFCPLKLKGGQIEWIEKKVNEGVLRFNTKVVFIDHLGFLAPKLSGDSAERNYSVYLGQICRQLKLLALDKHIIIFLLAHVRKTKEDLDMDDIAHSGGVAQESDFVFMVERERIKTSSPPKGKQLYGQNGFNWEDSGDVFSRYSKISLVKNRRTGITKFAKCEFINGKLQEVKQNVESSTIGAGGEFIVE